MRLSPPLSKEKYSEIVTHTYPIILSCLSGQKKTCTTANTISVDFVDIASFRSVVFLYNFGHFAK